MSPLLTVEQVADRLACSTSFVRREAKSGRLRFYKLGRGAIRFSEAQIQEYLDSCVFEASSRPRKAVSLHLKHLRL